MTETAHEKIRELCDTLTRQALDPAKASAERVLSEARSQAETLIQAAKDEAAKIIDVARSQQQQERGLFEASLRQAASQALLQLRNDIEAKLFRAPIGELLSEALNEPVTLTRLIRSLIDAIDRDGLAADLTIELAKVAKIGDINELLGERIRNRLRDGTCLLGNFAGGVRIRIADRGLSIDFSDRFLREIFEGQMHSAFAKAYFQTP